MDYLHWEGARFRHYAEMFRDAETCRSFLGLAACLDRFAERTREVCDHGEEFSTEDWDEVVEEALEDNQQLVEQVVFLREDS